MSLSTGKGESPVSPLKLNSRESEAIKLHSQLVLPMGIVGLAPWDVCRGVGLGEGRGRKREEGGREGIAKTARAGERRAETGCRIKEGGGRLKEREERGGQKRDGALTALKPAGDASTAKACPRSPQGSCRPSRAPGLACDGSCLHQHDGPPQAAGHVQLCPRLSAHHLVSFIVIIGQCPFDQVTPTGPRAPRGQDCAPDSS